MRLVNYLSITGVSAGIALLAFPSNAAIIPNLFPTGVDNSGTVLGDGASDPHYSILNPAGPGIVINQGNIPSSWLPNNSSSRWIWQTATGQPTNVTLTFSTTFDLTGFDPNSASITGMWAVDNFGLDILINGNSTGQTSPGFGSLVPFNINNGFLPGINTIEFVAQDVGFISGFRVDSISGTADLINGEQIPEPTSNLSLLILGTLGAVSTLKHKLNTNCHKL